MNKRSLLFAFVLLSVAMIVAACGGREQSSTDTAASETIAPDVAVGATMLVMLQDGAIAVREDNVPPGPVVFTIENRGTEVHNLFIEGPGVQRAAEKSVAPNEATTMDATLEAGSYVIYCPLLDHREKGEEATINVAR